VVTGDKAPAEFAARGNALEFSGNDDLAVWLQRNRRGRQIRVRYCRSHEALLSERVVEAAVGVKACEDEVAPAVRRLTGDDDDLVALSCCRERAQHARAELRPHVAAEATVETTARQVADESNTRRRAREADRHNLPAAQTHEPLRPKTQRRGRGDRRRDALFRVRGRLLLSLTSRAADGKHAHGKGEEQAGHHPVSPKRYRPAGAAGASANRGTRT